MSDLLSILGVMLAIIILGLAYVWIITTWVDHWKDRER